MARYAIVNGTTVENLVLWDEATPFVPVESMTKVKVTNLQKHNADIGGTYIGGAFAVPMLEE